MGRRQEILTSMSLSATHDLLPEALSSTGSGRVIFLNGASSSGKSTIAHELQGGMDGPWFHMAVDSFHRIRSRKDWTDEQFLPIFQRTVRGFHRAVAGLAAAGNDVVVDHILGERWRLTDCLDVLADHHVVFVGVHCPLPELEKRERERRDRQVGRAALQFPLVHAHGLYDVEVDTSRLTAAECAWRIKEHVDEGRPSSAFENLRARQTR
ncbi:MAG: chloramphenicol phosphotransferase CPT family protein [Nocardioidaceae bacterium]